MYIENHMVEGVFWAPWLQAEGEPEKEHTSCYQCGEKRLKEDMIKKVSNSGTHYTCVSCKNQEYEQSINCFAKMANPNGDSEVSILRRKRKFEKNRSVEDQEMPIRIAQQ